MRMVWRISSTERWLVQKHGQPGADQLGADVGLQIGEGQDQVGLELEDAVDAKAS